MKNTDQQTLLPSSMAIEKTAILSPCRRYRYALWRKWDEIQHGKGYAMVIGLNPSTADETEDDPTIRRCMAFARSWGYSGLCMANLFAYRATDPREMTTTSMPVGEENDTYLVDLAKKADVVVAAWGANGGHMGRDAVVRALIPNLHYLRLTKSGYPGHPLYLPGDLKPHPWGDQ